MSEIIIKKKQTRRYEITTKLLGGVLGGTIGLISLPLVGYTLNEVVNPEMINGLATVGGLAGLVIGAKNSGIKVEKRSNDNYLLKEIDICKGFFTAEY